MLFLPVPADGRSFHDPPPPTPPPPTRRPASQTRFVFGSGRGWAGLSCLRSVHNTKKMHIDCLQLIAPGGVSHKHANVERDSVKICAQIYHARMHDNISYAYMGASVCVCV